MVLDMKRVVFELTYREVVPVEDAAGARIDCLRGWIWITEHGAPGEVVLKAGEAYEIARGGAVVVQALREAIVAVRPPARSSVRAGLAARVELLCERWTAHATDTRCPAIASSGG